MSWNLVINEGLEVSAFSQFFEQAGIDVFHYTVLSLTGSPSAQAVTDELSSSIGPAYAAWLTSSGTFVGLKMRELTPTPAAPVYSTTAIIDGLGGGPIPRQLAGLITKRANIAGPRGIGHIYAPFPGADMMDGERLSIAGRTILTSLSTAIIGAPGDLVVAVGGGVSATLRPVIRGQPAGVFRTITEKNVSSQFATQRRRGFYGRPNALPPEFPI